MSETAVDAPCAEVEYFAVLQVAAIGLKAR
jgi:hypothetical protein